MKRILLAIILSVAVLSACSRNASDTDLNTEISANMTVTENNSSESTTTESTTTESTTTESTTTEITTEETITKTSSETVSESVTLLTAAEPDIRIDIPNDLFTENGDAYFLSLYSDGTFKALSGDGWFAYSLVETVNEFLERSEYSPDSSEYEQYRLELMERFEVTEKDFGDYDRTECRIRLDCEYFSGNNEKKDIAKTVFGQVITAANDTGLVLKKSAVTNKPCLIFSTYIVNENVIGVTAFYSSDDDDNDDANIFIKEDFISFNK